MYKRFFPHAQQVIYLDTAAEGLLLPQCAEALAAYARAKTLGTPGRREFHRTEAETLALAAQLLGTEPMNVALLPSASDAFNALATSLDWKPKDHIIISDLEFPSNVLPWLRLRSLGVDVTIVPSEKGSLSWESVVGRITPRTRLISLSLVSYRTGAYFPSVARIAAEAHAAGALLAIDATQALGRCPVSLDGVDYLMSNTFKWLLGPHGLAITYLSPEFRRKLRPASIGWYSVKNAFSPGRFETYELKDGAHCLPVGTPNFPSIYALRQALEFMLQVGVERLDQQLKPLVTELRQGFANLGLDLLTPADPEYASGIVSFAHARPEELGRRLEEKGIVVWAGDGRVRASVHLYNEADDIDRCLGALGSILMS